MIIGIFFTLYFSNIFPRAVNILDENKLEREMRELMEGEEGENERIGEQGQDCTHGSRE